MDDPHLRFSDAEFTQGLKAAGLKLVRTPGEGALGRALESMGIEHYDIRPEGASSAPEAKLTTAELGDLKARIDTLPKGTKVKPIDLHGQC